MKQTYYERASQLLFTHTFKSEVEKTIWKMHSEGIALREIGEKLNLNKDKVNHIIMDLRPFMNEDASEPTVEKHETPERPVSKKELIMIRPGSSNDKNLIYNSWLQGAYGGSDWLKLIDWEIYISNYKHVVEKILQKASTIVKVACLRDDLDTALGYAVLEPNIIHYIHVKEAWRGIGIATDLLKNHSFNAVTHTTAAGRGICRKKFKHVKFNPFLI